MLFIEWMLTTPHSESVGNKPYESKMTWSQVDPFFYLLNDGNKRSLTHQSPSFGISGNGHLKKRIFEYPRQKHRTQSFDKSDDWINHNNIWMRSGTTSERMHLLLSNSEVWEKQWFDKGNNVLGWSTDIPFSTVIIECSLQVDLEKEGKDVQRNFAVHFW